MHRFSRLIPDHKLRCISSAKTAAILAGSLASILSVGQVAYADDWQEDKSSVDLTAVPSLGTNLKNGTSQSASGSAGTAKVQSPYLMLSSPPKSTSSRPTKSDVPLIPNKSREYDVTISEYDRTSSQPAPRKNFLTRMTAAPAKALGVTCGVCVGVPVSIARDTRKYTGQMKRSMNDGLAVEKSGDFVGHLFSGACAVPFGIGSGLVHGSVTGFQRAVEHGQTQPFSKESMSLDIQEKSLSNRYDDFGSN